MEGTVGSICVYYGVHLSTSGNKHKYKNKRKDTKTNECVWHCEEGLTEKYVKGDVSIRDSLKTKHESKRTGVT